MKNLFIPPLSTEITLAAPWTFELYDESRNESLIKLLGLEFVPRYERTTDDESHQTVTLSAGTVLKIDRIYIRRGGAEFDSVTFFLKGNSLPGYAKSYTDRYNGEVRTYKVPRQPIRFWAKLEDVNTIMLES